MRGMVMLPMAAMEPIIEFKFESLERAVIRVSAM